MGVVLDLEEYSQLLEQTEELDAIQAYDAAKAEDDDVSGFPHFPLPARMVSAVAGGTVARLEVAMRMQGARRPDSATVAALR